MHVALQSFAATCVILTHRRVRPTFCFAEKYFDAYYQGKDDQYEQLSKASTQLKAIRMWSDWNVEMFEWETKHRSDTFDYFILRTEDLLDPATKFNTIRAVAEFVGSDVSEEQICCMAVAPASFMGSHSRGKDVRTTRLTVRFTRLTCIACLLLPTTGVTAHTAGSAANTVKSRYGTLGCAFPVTHDHCRARPHSFVDFDGCWQANGTLTCRANQSWKPR